MTRKLFRIAALALTVAGSPVAMAGEGENAVTGLTYEETEQSTLIHIAVANEPTFSVFKLRNPSRLLVEVSDCKASNIEALPIRNGVVDQTTVSTKDDRCRIITSFDNEAPYDVDATSGEIILSVDAGDRVMADDSALQAKLADREAELERTRGELDRAEGALDQLRNDREQATKRVADLEKAQKELSTVATKMDSAEQELAAARKRIKDLEAAESELKKARAAAGELAKKQAELDEARSHLTELETARTELSKATTELGRLQADLESERQRAANLGADFDSQAAAVAVLNGQVDALKGERDEAREKISRLANERDQAARRAEVAETRAGELEQEVERLKVSLERTSREDDRVDDLAGKLDSAESQRKKLEKKLAALQDEVANGGANAERDLADAEQKLRESTRKTDTLRAEMDEIAQRAEKEATRLKSELADKESAMKEAQKKAAKLKKASDTKVAELASALQERDEALEDKEAELTKLKEQETELLARLAAANGSEESDNASLKDEINALKRKSAQLTTEMEREMGELKSTLGEREEALARAREREQELLSKYEALEAERQKEQVAVSSLMDSKESQLETMRLNEAKLREELAALNEASSTSGDDPTLNTALFEKEAELNRALDKQSDLKEDVRTLAARLEQNRDEVERVKAQADAAATAARTREDSLQEEIGRLDALASRTEKQLGDAQQQAKALKQEVDALNGQLAEAKAESDAKAARLAQLEEKVLTAAEQNEELQAQDKELKALRTKLEQATSQASNTQDLQARIDELENSEREMETLRKQLATAESARKEAEVLRKRVADAEGIEAEMERLRAKADDAQAARDELRKLRGKVADTEKAAKELELLRARLAEAEEARTELETLKSKAADGDAAAAELAKLKVQLEDAKKTDAEVETLRGKLAAMETAHQELDTLRARAADADDARAEVERLKAELASAKLDRTTEATAKASAPLAKNSAPAAKGKAPLAQVASNGAPLDTAVAKKNNTKVSSPHVGVKDIRFEKEGEFSRVLIELDGNTEYHTTPWGDGKATLVLRDANIPESLIRKLDTRAFRGPVEFVSSFEEQADVHLVAELTGASSEVVRVEGQTLIWEFAQASSEVTASTFDKKESSGFVDRRKKVRIAAAEPAFNTRTAGDDDITVSFGKRERLRSGKLSRRRISLDVRDADINDLLRLIADEAAVSIITSPDVSGRVTLSLKSVPLDQALDIILRAQELGMKQEGNILWVAPASVFREEQRQALEAALVREKLEPLEVRLLPVNYADAGALSSNVASLLSERGSVQIDARTNTLIIKDVGANLDAAEILVESLDTQTPQILIEARIVETQSNYAKEIGIQWGGDFSFSPANGNPTGLVFPSTVGVAGGSTSDNNSGTVAQPNFAVNLPAAVGTGSGGAMGMTFGSIGGAVNLNLRLSALEEKGFVKIVSAPRIMTLDNVQASISQGVSIPVSVVSAAGVQTAFFDANLNLSVTPHVTKDGNIFLNIDVTKNEPDFGNTGASGDPSIIRKEAHTQLLIPDGDTTVIGGIYTRNTSQGVNSVPFFGDIPFIGYFFRKTNETDNRTELLIFITPRIINRESSIGVSGPGSFLAPEPEEVE